MPEPLTPLHRRLIGVLIEKGYTTPEQYPLSANAMAVGASQKTNRDPLMEVDENAALDAIGQLRKRDLVELANISTGRVNRWKHRAREVWSVERPQLAILAELLLRGPQTLGELRTRASRMYPFESLEVVEATLDSLVKRPDPLIEPCAPAAGGRAGRFRHTFYARNEIAAIEATQPIAVSGAGASTETPAQLTTVLARLDALEREVAELRRRIEAAGG